MIIFVIFVILACWASLMALIVLTANHFDERINRLRRDLKLDDVEDE